MPPQIQKILDQVLNQDIKVRYVIFTFLILTVVAIDYSLVFNSQLAGIASTAEATVKISDDVQKVKDSILRVNNVKKGLEKMKVKFQALNSKIRDISEVSAIFEEISRVANESDVHIDQLSPSKEGQELLLTGVDGKYYALPIVISARSGYHMFSRFLGELENSNIVFLVNNLKLDGNDKDIISIGIQAAIKIVLVDRTSELKK